MLFVSKVENKIFQIEKYKNVQNFIHNKMQKLINDGKKIKKNRIKIAVYAAKKKKL